MSVALATGRLDGGTQRASFSPGPLVACVDVHCASTGSAQYLTSAQQSLKPFSNLRKLPWIKVLEEDPIKLVESVKLPLSHKKAFGVKDKRKTCKAGE